MEIRVEEEAKERLDKYLTKYLEESRSYIIKMIKNGNVLVNGEEVSPHYEVRLDDVITVDKEYKEVYDVLGEEDSSTIFDKDNTVIPNINKEMLNVCR